MVVIEFPPASSAADWSDSVLLTDDSDTPLWADVPDDLTVSITVIRDRETTPALSSPSIGTAAPNGIIDLRISADDMKTLAPDTHEADVRYRMFALLKTTTSTAQPFIGILTVLRGA